MWHRLSSPHQGVPPPHGSTRWAMLAAVSATNGRHCASLESREAGARLGP